LFTSIEENYLERSFTMCKKVSCLMFLLLAAQVGVTSAVTENWWSGASSDLWDVAGNWWGGHAPRSSELAFLDLAGDTTTINSSMSAVCSRLYVGDWSWQCYLNITGGTLNIGNDFVTSVLQYEGGYGAGFVTMTGGTVTVGGNLVVCLNGWWSLFEMTGGTINVTGTLWVPGGDDPNSQGASYGELHLYGGTITAGDFDSNDLGGGRNVDFVAGQLLINRDDRQDINDGITQGWITAYGGELDVAYDYNTTTGKTTVKAIGCHWTGAGANTSWNTAANWVGGVPTSSKFAGLVTPNKLCQIGSGVTAQCQKCMVGYYNNYSGGQSVTLQITGGGSLTTGSDLILGGTDYATGIVDINNGTVDVNGLLRISSNGCLVNICNGTLKLTGDQTAQVYSDIEIGNIKAFNGTGVLLWDYNVTNAGKTTITAAIPVNQDWSNGAGTNLWSTTTNWTQGSVPTKYDVAKVNVSDANCVINATMNAVCRGLIVGNTASSCRLNMTGGTLKVGENTMPSNTVIGNESNGVGTINMSGGTAQIEADLLVGNNGTGTLNMSGGTLNIDKTLLVAAGKGSGTVNLSGGTINAGADNPNAGLDIKGIGTGLVNITTGTLIINGDATARVKEYSASGKIVAYSGRGRIVYDYNVTNAGKTTITAVSENGIAYNPNPVAGATDQSTSPTLTWTKGDWVASTGGHRVFLGTSFDDVNNATTGSPQYEGTVDVNSYNATGLIAGQTYYWRIDEVNSSNPSSPWKGNIWNFEVVRPSNFRTSFNFNNDWRYYRGAISGDTASGSSYNADYDWKNIAVPYSFRIAPLDTAPWLLNTAGVNWYRKYFKVPAAYNGKKIFIEFEGVDNKAWVWINGTAVSSHQGAYHAGAFLPFTVDITNYVNFGSTANVLAVKSNSFNDTNIPEFARDGYGGIWRNVKMHITDKLYVTDAVDANVVAGGGIYVSFSNVSTSSATVQVKTHVRNAYTSSKSCKVRTLILDANDDVVTSNTTGVQNISASGSYAFTQTLTVSNPHLWSPSQPYLYTVVTEVYDGSTHVDSYKTPIGIKKIAFSDTTGFSLNDQRLIWTGVNRLQTYPWVGIAASDFQQKLDARRMRDAGWNSVRTAHCPTSDSFMEACDELGLMVDDSIPGFHYYSAGTFEQRSYETMREMVRRDRNHASPVVWELQINEGEYTTAYSQNAVAIGHAELPQDPCFVCGWKWDDDDVFDVFLCAAQHGGRDYNGVAPLIISEHGHWDFGGDNSTSNAYRGDEAAMLQQAWNHQESHHLNLARTDLCGDNVWAFNDRGVPSGTADVFRLPKYSYYFWQSQRDPNLVLADANSGPMVYIADQWTSGSTTVRVYSNCDQVKLYINSSLQSTRSPDTGYPTANLLQPPFTFTGLTFSSGELKAEGLIGGVVKATHIVRTPGSASALNVRFDTMGYNVTANGEDMVFVYVSVVDSSGTVVPTATNAVTLQVTGPATLISSAVANAEAGIASFLIRTTSEVGVITASATASGLTSGNNTLTTVPWTDRVTWFETLSAPPDTTAPTPNPMTFATNPTAASDTNITMTATTATDDSGVEYYFHETTGHAGGSDSNWQDSTTYTDTGLDPNTTYTYQVKARDKSANQNETAYSTTQSATTYQIRYPNAYVVSQGTYGSGTVSDLQVDDTSYLVINSTTVSPRTATTDFNVPGITVSSPSQIMVRTVTKSSQTSTTQTVYLWNYSTSVWDSKDTATVGTSEVIRDITVSSGTSSYISGGLLKVRVGAVKSSKAFAYSHDQIKVTLKP
jgi:beta-galactosidase